MDNREKSKPSVAVVTIATNKYIHYWSSMARTIDKFATSENLITFHVFTDQPKVALSIESELRNSVLKVLPVESWSWPEVALKRYEVIRHATSKCEQDFVMYIDADMLALSKVPNIRSLLNNKSIALTSHPGFWRPKGKQRLLTYLKSPIMAIRDFRMFLRIGGLGAWESRPQSRAFVERANRKVYVCGGFWFGEKKAIATLSLELMQNTSRDTDADVEAVWLDESHLNRWASGNSNLYTLLNPEFCFDPSYIQLSSLVPVIEAVNKAKNPIEIAHE